MADYDSRKELVEYLTQIKAETGRGTLVIAHSMGGLVALHALSKSEDPTLFTGIIFGSTPFAGTPNIFQPFRWGDSILFNKTICSPSTVFSFRSSFYLLPTAHLKPPFENSKREPLAVDINDPECWKKYGLSPIAGKLAASQPSERRKDEAQAATSAAGVASAIGGQQLDGRPHLTFSPTDADGPDEAACASDATIESYLRTTLQRVARFREDLISGYDSKKAHLYPPLAIITADHTATVCGAIIDTEDELIAGQYDRLLFDKGDGIILHSSSTALPEPWKPHLRSTIHSRHGHVSLLSDLGAVSQALDSLRLESS
jgi:pimeloyl-ACP methyl ester carboxylesterase